MLDFGKIKPEEIPEIIEEGNRQKARQDSPSQRFVSCECGILNFL